MTNKKERAGRVVSYHDGRGYQEKKFGEAKSQGQLGYVPCKRRVANEAYMLCSVIAHYLGRELQMQASADEAERRELQKLWQQQLATLSEQLTTANGGSSTESKSP